MGSKAAEEAKASTRKSTKRSIRNKSAEREEKAAPVAEARLPENKHPDLHQRSYAAHLDAGPQEPHVKPAGTPRHGSLFMGRKQP